MSSRIQRTISVLTGIFLVSNVIFASVPDFNQPTENVKGVLKYQGEKSLPLKGEWKLFWNQLYSEDSSLLCSHDYHFVPCPDLWKNIQIDDLILPSQGYGSYALDFFLRREFLRHGY